MQCHSKNLEKQTNKEKLKLPPNLIFKAKTKIADDKEEDSKMSASTNEVVEESEEESEEDVELENMSVSESANEITLDESVLAQNIENLHKVKEEVEEEVLEAIEKIPVVIKPRKRRGRPKKKH